MSGIEVAGVILGPSLSSLNPWMLIELILNELIKSVIRESGCEDVSAFEDDAFIYLDNPDVQQQVGQFLGPRNTRVLIDELEASSETVRKVAKCISSLVPGFQGPEDDLFAIIKANQEKPSLVADLAPRIKLLLNITKIKEATEEIDKSSGVLDHLWRVALPNCQSMNSNLSRKSQKLAKAFRQIRGLAGGLYDAVLHGFRDGCHDSHEARLYLDDRIDTAHQVLNRRSAACSDAPLMMFDLVFHAGGQKDDTLYYETAVQVFDDRIIANTGPGSTPESVRATVTISVTDDPPASRPNVTSITNICTTIKEAREMKLCLSFALLGNRQMCTFPDHNAVAATRSLCQEDWSYVSLSQVLKTSTSTLPLKSRMKLSLRLSSSLLQLLQTPWLTQAWRKDAVFFLVSGPPSIPTSRAPRSAQIDLSRPFVVCNFSGESSEVRSTETRAVLLELGIILLEIWHGITLEAHFGLDESDRQSHSPKYFERLAQALEWEADWTNPMPGLFGETVSHCLRGNNVSAGKNLDWEDLNVWNSICGDIIEPLSKLYKNF